MQKPLTTFLGTRFFAQNRFSRFSERYCVSRDVAHFSDANRESRRCKLAVTLYDVEERKEWRETTEDKTRKLQSQQIYLPYGLSLVLGLGFRIAIAALAAAASGSTAAETGVED